MRFYRFFLDLFEEMTTAMAHTILVNSKFTQGIYLESFSLIQRCCKSKVPQILYPAINEKNYVVSQDAARPGGVEELLQRPNLGRDTLVLTSLNRYERKKNINLALESFAKYVKKPGARQDTLLVIAGGYDERLLENVEHHLELVNLAKSLGVMEKVVFLRSISNDERVLLLQRTDVLLYTPANEHFGIVPVEAMWLGCAVIACNSGGPLESIADGKTGYLRAPDASIWSE